MNLSEPVSEALLRRREYTRTWQRKNPEKVLARKQEWMKKPENRIKHTLSQAKRRAIKDARDFDITIEDLLPLPKICPVLGIEINYTGTQARGFVDNSPSIDRVDSSRGYVKGNVQIISWRANRVKSDASIKELEAVIKYMEGHQSCN